MSRLRVFAVISSSQFGGAERYFAALLKGLAASGVEVTVACQESGPMVNEYRALAARVVPMDLSNILAPGTVESLAALMREAKAELVHTHLWNADALGGTAASRAGLPAISTVYGAYHLPIGVSGLRGFRRRVLSVSYRAVYRRFSWVIALSNYIRDDLTGRPGIGVAAEKIEVIAPALDLALLRTAGADRGGLSRIVCVANFFPIKGQEWLLRAMPRVLEPFPEVRCLFIGDGPDRAPMEALAASLGVGTRVEFAGSHARPFEIISSSDIFVLPSVSEGLPLAVLEAWAQGIPVVASRAGGIPELIDDGCTGLLTAPRDSAGIAGAIIRLLNDPALGRRLAAAGQASLRSRFSTEALAAATSTAYRRVLGGR